MSRPLDNDHDGAEDARVYHAFWAIVERSYPPAELRAITVDARNRWYILGALGELDRRERLHRGEHGPEGWRV